jgi:hypothetical protein
MKRPPATHRKAIGKAQHIDAPDRPAASLKGMTLSDYATKVLLETANRDIDEFANTRLESPRTTKPRRKPPEN